LGDYREQKKREKDAPYDNIFMSTNDGVDFKVNSFTCFQPNENLMMLDIDRWLLDNGCI